MQTVATRLIFACISVALTSCSTKVPIEQVYGTYVASYPFGTDTLTLYRDGGFVQRVAVRNEQPATVRGSWRSHPEESRVDLYGSVVVADGFGHLRSDWRTTADLPGVVSLPVERWWSKIVIGDYDLFPYVKQ